MESNLKIYNKYPYIWVSQMVLVVKNPPSVHETGFYPLEKDMETHSSILAEKIPWTEEAGGL